MKTLLLLMTSLLIPPAFKEQQLKYARVRTAYDEKEAVVKKYFSDKKIAFAGFQLFIRALKQEAVVEVWVKERRHNTFALLHTYPFCATSGTPGPKRREGDGQIPEGVYHIEHFNPNSNFYLSLGINYPNASDKILGDKQKPGSDIYIHGNCVTVGCIPLTDDKIKELYVLAVEARQGGQENIPVHIFPSKLTADALISLKQNFREASTISFWENLKPIYDDFEKTKKLRTPHVTASGAYVF
ncbi:L,D-transpeptidase family protein [Chryseolinea lacunae]|uniref:L,D-transpeptidase family protein n=1 Tax=Chryseolinea lacunae TaxID=2801331 RepID=A0ABS1KT37_9BACT|nr:L,D-transpeptidase family protein [Chryseolinea lacunae]MBL0742520.1 L,D-transpeptidase family protein [Chryseolinea lacunae]